MHKNKRILEKKVGVLLEEKVEWITCYDSHRLLGNTDPMDVSGHVEFLGYMPSRLSYWWCFHKVDSEFPEFILP